MGHHLRAGATQGCRGCSGRRVSAAMVQHGHARAERSAEYRAWCNMIGRCERRSAHAFHRYGGRGISIAPMWRESFEAFFRDVGPRPSPRHTLDRIDFDGDYEPGNVRWATARQQHRNRSDNRALTVGERTMLLVEWAEEAGIAVTTLHERLRRGWSPERAVSTPVCR